MECENKTDKSLLFFENENENKNEILVNSTFDSFNEISSKNYLRTEFSEGNYAKDKNYKIEINNKKSNEKEMSKIIKNSKNLNNFDVNYDLQKNKKKVNLIPYLVNDLYKSKNMPPPLLLHHILVSTVLPNRT